VSPGQVENSLPKVTGEGLLLTQGIEPSERQEEGLLDEVLGDVPEACQEYASRSALRE
jgi:hypothetical protein